MHYLLIILAIIFRFIPHPWNVTPIASIGLFAGTWCDRRIAWLFPLVPLVIGDALTGFYHPLIMVFVYAGIAMSALVGHWLLSSKRSALRFASAIGINGVMFYLVSNFPVWLVYYPNTVAGLAECYLKGLPYMGYSLAGDCVFVTLIFGVHRLGKSLVASREKHAIA